MPRPIDPRLPPVNIGFSGTEEGMSRPQEFALRHLLMSLRPREFHHGMCVGADEEAHYIILTLNRTRSLGCTIHGHPGLTKDGKVWKRAFCPSLDDEWEPMPFLARNTDIVRVTDMLVAAPLEFDEVQRSGTWATVRRARKMQKPYDVVYPDGNIVSYREVYY